jgi:hypothetical protein
MLACLPSPPMKTSTTNGNEKCEHDMMINMTNIKWMKLWGQYDVHKTWNEIARWTLNKNLHVTWIFLIVWHINAKTLIKYLAHGSHFQH